MERIKWLTYIIKDFLAMLSAWQLDHAFSKYVWRSNKSLEVARLFGIPLFMRETDFWVLCIFVLLLALFLPEIYIMIKWLKERLFKKKT